MVTCFCFKKRMFRNRSVPDPPIGIITYNDHGQEKDHFLMLMLVNILDHSWATICSSYVWGIGKLKLRTKIRKRSVFTSLYISKYLLFSIFSARLHSNVTEHNWAHSFGFGESDYLLVAHSGGHIWVHRTNSKTKHHHHAPNFGLIENVPVSISAILERSVDSSHNCMAVLIEAH